jgi:hypothetical protein
METRLLPWVVSGYLSFRILSCCCAGCAASRLCSSLSFAWAFFQEACKSDLCCQHVAQLSSCQASSNGCAGTFIARLLFCSRVLHLVDMHQPRWLAGVCSCKRLLCLQSASLYRAPSVWQQNHFGSAVAGVCCTFAGRIVACLPNGVCDFLSMLDLESELVDKLTRRRVHY